MNRTLFPIFFLLCTLYGCAPTKKTSVVFPSPFEFEQIDTVSGASKDVLYVRARAWLAHTYGSSKKVVEMEDKVAGKIIGNAATTWPVRAGFGNVLCESPIFYTLTVDVKEGRYRCVLSDFRHKGCNYHNTALAANGTSASGGSLDQIKQPSSLVSITNEQWFSIKKKAMTDAQATMASFKAAMHEDIRKSAKDDW